MKPSRPVHPCEMLQSKGLRARLRKALEQIRPGREVSLGHLMAADDAARARAQRTSDGTRSPSQDRRWEGGFTDPEASRTSTSDQAGNFLCHGFHVLMRPRPHDGPSATREHSVRVPIALSVGLDLLPPPSRVLFGPSAMNPTAVPEATVDEYRHPC